MNREHEPKVLKEVRAFIENDSLPPMTFVALVSRIESWLSWMLRHIDKLTENNLFMEKRINELESEIKEYQAGLPPLSEDRR